MGTCWWGVRGGVGRGGRLSDPGEWRTQLALPSTCFAPACPDNNRGKQMLTSSTLVETKAHSSHDLPKVTPEKKTGTCESSSPQSSSLGCTLVIKQVLSPFLIWGWPSCWARSASSLNAVLLWCPPSPGQGLIAGGTLEPEPAVTTVEVLSRLTLLP